MTRNDYIFTKRMQGYINNRFLDLLVKGYERNVSILQRKKIEDFIKNKRPPKNPEELLLLYILFHKNKPYGYLDELGKYLINRIKVDDAKELDEMYRNYKEELELLNFKKPRVNKQVVKNIKHYLSELDFSFPN